LEAKELEFDAVRETKTGSPEIGSGAFLSEDPFHSALHRFDVSRRKNSLRMNNSSISQEQTSIAVEDTFETVLLHFGYQPVGLPFGSIEDRRQSPLSTVYKCYRSGHGISCGYPTWRFS
jgi:hypothetical protein